MECTQTYCGICKLRLNGAIHALQHYDSKKHRASERKAKAAEKGKAKAKQPGLGDNVSSQTVRAEKPELLQDGRDCEKHALLETAVADAAPQSAAASRDTAERSTISPCGAAPVGSKTIPVRGGVEKPMKYKLNRAMKQVLKDAPKQKLKRGRLIAAVSQVLGGETPDNIGELLNKRVRKSKHFEMRKDRIFLIL